MRKPQVLQQLAQKHHSGKHAGAVGQVLLVRRLAKGLQHQAAEQLLDRVHMQQRLPAVHACGLGQHAHILGVGEQLGAGRNGGAGGLNAVFRPVDGAFQGARIQGAAGEKAAGHGLVANLDLGHQGTGLRVVQLGGMRAQTQFQGGRHVFLSIC